MGRRSASSVRALMARTASGTRSRDAAGPVTPAAVRPRITGDRTRERTRGERHTEGRAPDEPGPQEGSPVQPVRERTQAGQAAPGASGRELPHADAERQPHHAVRRVRAEEERMDVPGRRQEQRQVDQEAHHRGEHHEGTRQHGQPHGDLGEGDRHAREHRRVPEHAEQRPRGGTRREPAELGADEVRTPLAQEVRIEELLRAGEHERAAEERPQDAERPRHLPPSVDERGPRVGSPRRVQIRSPGPGDRRSRVGSHARRTPRQGPPFTR